MSTAWPPPGMTAGQITLAVVRWKPRPRVIPGTVLAWPERPPLNDLLVIRQWPLHPSSAINNHEEN